MKKFISLILALVIAVSSFSALSVVAFADDTDNAETLAVTVDGVTTNVPVGEKFSYTYTLTDVKILNAEAEVAYDSDMLQVTSVLDTDPSYEEWLAQVFPRVADYAVLNTFINDLILYNFSKSKGVSFTGEQTLATFEFTALAAGETTIKTNIIEMVDTDKNYYVDKTPEGSVQYMDIPYREFVEYTAPIIPTEPETEPETQPETEPETQPETEPETQPTEPEVKKVQNVNCTDVTRDSFTVNWDALDGADMYRVCINGAVYTATADTSYTVTGRKSGVTYKVQVIVKIDGVWTEVADADVVEVTALNKVENVKAVDVKAFEIEVAWDETVGATKYWVYTNDGAYKSTTETSMLITKRVPETLYNIYVVAVFEDGYMFDKANADVVTVTTADLGPVISTTRYDFPLTDDVKASDKAWLLYGKSADKQVVFNTVDLTKDTFRIANLDYDTDYYYSFMYMKNGKAITTETFVAHTEANPDYNAITANVTEDGKLVVNWNQVNQTYKYWIFKNGALVAWTDGETTLTLDEYDLNDELYIEGAYRWQEGTRQIKYQKAKLSDILA